MVFEKKMLTYGDPDDEVRQVTGTLLVFLYLAKLRDLTSGESPVSTGFGVRRWSVSALANFYYLIHFIAVRCRSQPIV